MPPGGIENLHFQFSQLCQPGFGGSDRVAAAASHRDVQLRRQLRKLLERRRPVDVNASHPDREPFELEPFRQFPGGGCLALPVKSHEHDFLRTWLQVARCSQRADHLTVHDAHNVLARGHPCRRLLLQRAALDALAQIQRQLDVDICLQQRPLDVADQLLDELR